MANRGTASLKAFVIRAIGALPISEGGKRRLVRQALTVYRQLSQPGARHVRIPPLPAGESNEPTRASRRLPHRPRRERLAPIPDLAPDQPEVSIVVPVFNELPFTLQCLEAIEENTHGCRYEVIVVDDHSSDGTAETLATRPGIQYLRNPENLGFIRSCNRGAQEARGSYLVMLNNDTEVMTNWLIELLDTFWSKKNAGLVGAKLLYPTGALQEAGGILWQDGSAWNYGRGDHPNRPEYNYLREVDYISGACIMLPKALWDRLGGFDLHFAPAYCEDSDLALRVSQAGLKVYYQPMAEVIHYEGVSSGTDTSAGVKAHQVENSRKLYERWRHALAGHRPNAQEPEKEKERNVSRRILIVDDTVPTPDKDAGSITTLGIMNMCQRLGFKVTFVPETNFAWEEGYSEALARIGIESIAYPFCKSVKQHLRDRGRSYDAILVFRAGIASQYLSIMRRLAPQARIVFHTSDLHYVRLRREARLKSAPSIARSAERTRLSELRVVAEADCTIVHSSREREILLQDEGIDKPVVLFPWILETRPRRKGFEDRRDLFFMGGYQHTANVDAVRYFATEVWPLVAEQIAGARFLIVGSSAPPEVEALASEEERVDYLGFVEDLDGLMQRTRLSVAPVRFGAGIKGKIAMSMAYGVPCVTTPLGAEGMDLRDEVDILIAEDAAGFADAVVRLHEDGELWERMSLAAQDHVDSHYSPAKGMEIMREVLQVGTREPD